MITNNIATAWSRLSDDDIDMGRKAYPSYHTTLRGLADHYDAPFVQSVEAFAALSPNNDYHGNLRSLVSLLEARQQGRGFDTCTISTYRACGKRAWSYLTGEVSFLDTVKGEKITKFRHNILYPETSQHITVDGHMIALALGDHKMTMTEANLAGRGMYGDIERAVISVARRHDEAPLSVQAALWTWRKRTLGIKMDTQRDLFTGGTRWDRTLAPEEIPPFKQRALT